MHSWTGFIEARYVCTREILQVCPVWLCHKCARSYLRWMIWIFLCIFQITLFFVFWQPLYFEAWISVCEFSCRLCCRCFPSNYLLLEVWLTSAVVVLDLLVTSNIIVSSSSKFTKVHHEGFLIECLLLIKGPCAWPVLLHFLLAEVLVLTHAK